MFECSHVVPGWNDEGKEEANGREEGIWRIEGPKMRPTYTLSDQQAHMLLGNIQDCFYIDSTLQRPFDWASSHPTWTRLQSLGNCRRRQELYCWKIHRQVPKNVRCIKSCRVDARGGNLDPPPGDHADLGGVEKAEGCQWRYGGLFGSVQAYPNLRVSKKRKKSTGDSPRLRNPGKVFVACFWFLTKGDFEWGHYAWDILSPIRSWGVLLRWHVGNKPIKQTHSMPFYAIVWRISSS